MGLGETGLRITVHLVNQWIREKPQGGIAATKSEAQNSNQSIPWRGIPDSGTNLAFLGGS